MSAAHLRFPPPDTNVLPVKPERIARFEMMTKGTIGIR